MANNKLQQSLLNMLINILKIDINGLKNKSQIFNNGQIK